MAERGFTLLEVVVALIVFGLTFGAFATIFSTGFRQSAAAERAIEASLVARSLINQIGNEARLEPGRFGDQLDDGWRFEASIEQVGRPDADYGFAMYRIKLSVFEAEQTPDQGVRMTTLRLGPADGDR